MVWVPGPLGFKLVAQRFKRLCFEDLLASSFVVESLRV